MRGQQSDDDVLAQKEARDSGECRYVTKTKCKDGHTTERYTLSRQCVTCGIERSKKRNAERQAARDKDAEWAKKFAVIKAKAGRSRKNDPFGWSPPSMNE